MHYAAAMVRIGEWLCALDRRKHPGGEGLVASFKSPVEFAHAVVRAGLHEDSTDHPLVAALIDVWHMVATEEGKYPGGALLFESKVIFVTLLALLSVTVECAGPHCLS